MATENKKEKYFWTGTLCLYLGIICVTYLPKLIYEFFVYLELDALFIKSLAVLLFVTALGYYFASSEFFKKQAFAIVFCFIFYFIYMNFFGY